MSLRRMTSTLPRASVLLLMDTWTTSYVGSPIILTMLIRNVSRNMDWTAVCAATWATGVVTGATVATPTVATEADGTGGTSATSARVGDDCPDCLASLLAFFWASWATVSASVRGCLAFFFFSLSTAIGASVLDTWARTTSVDSGTTEGSGTAVDTCTAGAALSSTTTMSVGSSVALPS